MLPLLIKDQPHWECNFPSFIWPYYVSFELFLEEVWKHLRLPDPTLAQRQISRYLQYGCDSTELDFLLEEEKLLRTKARKQTVIRAFRSLGKSYITSAFIIWNLIRNPKDEKALVVSASGQKAREFVSQTRSIINSMPLVAWLFYGSRANNTVRRDMADRFDVTLSSLSQSFSLKAAGITSQITGSRATTIVADDIEVEDNSRTEEGRMRLLRAISNDFSAIVKTERKELGSIIFLGTPRHEESIYNTLVKSMGYDCFTIPARMPKEDKIKNYTIMTENGTSKDILAPYIMDGYSNGTFKEGCAIDDRYDDRSLLEIEVQGSTAFALNYMLDTTLSDADRYPLKLKDLIIMQVAHDKAPISVSWGKHNERRNFIMDLPHVGFTGDVYLRPLFIDEQWREYEEAILFVDPAGRGKDETAWVVVKILNGYLYLVSSNGTTDPETSYIEIAKTAKMHNVHTIFVEPNAGQGMWMYAMQPVLNKLYPHGCVVKESEWSRGQKELRIIDTLEPILLQHRLVISEDVVRSDLRNVSSYSLLYQLTHITRDRGCLSYDDRLDALAGAVLYFTKHMATDTQEALEEMKEAELEALHEDFLMWLEDPWDGDLRCIQSVEGGYVYRGGI